MVKHDADIRILHSGSKHGFAWSVAQESALWFASFGFSGGLLPTVSFPQMFWIGRPDMESADASTSASAKMMR